jgi:hypothetical protein
VPVRASTGSDSSGDLTGREKRADMSDVVKPKRQHSKNSPRDGVSEVTPKVLIYEALATLNRDFEQVLGDLERLEELRLFPHRWQRMFLKTWRATLEETRAWANFEVVEILHHKEERDWVDFGRIRQRSEKSSAAPTDKLAPIKSRERKSATKSR